MTRSEWIAALKYALVAAGAITVLVSLHPLLQTAPLWVRQTFLASLAVGAVAIVASSTFRRWLRVSVAESYKGLRIPGDVLVHPGHTWARNDGRSRVTIGVDDLLVRTLGTPEAIDLPEPGTIVREGEPLFKLRRGSRTVTIRAPMSGTVLDTNPMLAQEPKLLARYPYHAGWILGLSVPSPRRSLKQFMGGRRARDWFRGEVDRLIGTVHHELLPGSAMADGGVLVDDFHVHLEDDVWTRIASAFFGDAADASPWPKAHLRYHGGDLVGRGDYWSFDEGEQAHVEGWAVLPGSASTTYYRLPSLVFLAMAPLLGIVYAIFLPFIGMAMLLAVGVEALAGSTARALRHTKS